MIRATHNMEVNRVKKHARIDAGLTAEDRDGVVEILNQALADEIVLYAITRNYHWNVVGPRFHDLHVFFETQYEELAKIGDAVAERARSLGGPARGTLEESLKNSQLEERPGQELTAKDMIDHLLQSHGAIIGRLRKDLATCADKYHDMGTNNFLTDLMERHEKMAWMLRACLEQRA